MKRPKLNVGDVCKASKKYLRLFRGAQSNVYVVHQIISGDGIDGRSRIRVILHSKSRLGKYNRPHKATMKRRDLWFTGHNVNNNKVKVQKPKAILEALGMVKPRPNRGPHLCRCDRLTILNHGCQCNGL